MLKLAPGSPRPPLTATISADYNTADWRTDANDNGLPSTYLYNSVGRQRRSRGGGGNQLAVFSQGAADLFMRFLQ